MAKSKRAEEGEWYAVPLADSGFAVGLVARANQGGVLLGYFFGPKREMNPDKIVIKDLCPQDSILVSRFGHLGIKNGRWPLIGTDRDFSRDDWPIPQFIRYEELTGRTYAVTYDDDASQVIGEERVEPVAAEQRPKDGLMGDTFVELLLGRMLTPPDGPS